MLGNARDIVDAGRFPLDEPDSAAYVGLRDRCRAALADDGAAVLEGFAPPSMVEALIDEVTPSLAGAFFKPKTHNVFLVADDPARPARHPRNRKETTTSATLGYDGVPRGGLLDRLYGWPALRAFLADVLGFQALYPYRDPLSPLNILVYQDGAATGWHFDGAQFVVTLMLRPASAGGVFEYVPFVRGEDDESFARIGGIVDGVGTGVRELRQPAGALVIFRGSRTLHRVTTVTGTPRLVAVFSYSPDPNFELDPHTRQTFYGKVA
jgi:hypothetical protein